MTALTLTLEPIFTLNNEQFQQLCLANPDLKLERTATGELVIMPPTGGETGRQNSQLNFQIQLWNQQYQFGEVFDSSTGFILPNGATRSPDVAWIEKSRWQALTPEQREKFLPLCPDFVIELVSPSDSVQKARQKMEEYRANACRLGWLINRQDKQVEIYRLNREVESLSLPVMLKGEDVLINFEIQLL
ncbi:MAG: Uma2 family endonuclease [Snowella sp.]|nr:Uma2 family endonuclease [Snowella sp.]